MLVGVGDPKVVEARGQQHLDYVCQRGLLLR